MLAAALDILAPADSARAVERVYEVSLLATLPLVLAAAAAIGVRRAPAGTRALVWRSAIAALLLLYAGRFLPSHWMAWVVPGSLASPLVALGRMQLAVAEAASPGAQSLADAASQGAAGAVRALLVAYWLGVALALAPLLRAWRQARATARRAQAPRDTRWALLLADARARLGIARPIRLLETREAAVPATWGVVRPTVLVPAAAAGWTDAQCRTVLLHELAHVRAGDAAFAIAARVACALFWFHPAVWWIARALRADAELACDDRVLASGVRPSEYAELLVLASDTLGGAATPALAVAVARRVGLRERLAAIVTTGRDLRAPRRHAVALAGALTVAVAVPVGTVELAPTRDVLTALVRDARWETRAYAVVGLAQRRDSVDVARAVAAKDPSPHVRAWASYALDTLARPAARR